MSWFGRVHLPGLVSEFEWFRFLDPDDRIPLQPVDGERDPLYAIWEGNQYTISYEKYRANQDTSLWTTTAPIPYGTQITIDLVGGTCDWADTIFTLTGDTALPKPTKVSCEFSVGSTLRETTPSRLSGRR